MFCRIRPITMAENFGRLRPAVAADSSTVLLKLADNKSKNYSFDRVFHPGSSQGNQIPFYQSLNAKKRRVLVC